MTNGATRGDNRLTERLCHDGASRTRPSVVRLWGDCCEREKGQDQITGRTQESIQAQTGAFGIAGWSAEICPSPLVQAGWPLPAEPRIPGSAGVLRSIPGEGVKFQAPPVWSTELRGVSLSGNNLIINRYGERSVIV